MLRIKRIYDDANKEDGYRILIDGLWARGISKEKARLDYWAKEIAPSHTLRKDFHHGDETFEDFKKHYLEELNNNDERERFLELIKEKMESGNITLLYAAKNETINNAVVLKQWVKKIYR